jgi:hypothetical protein
MQNVAQFLKTVNRKKIVSIYQFYMFSSSTAKSSFCRTCHVSVQKYLHTGMHYSTVRSLMFTNRLAQTMYAHMNKEKKRKLNKFSTSHEYNCSS